jgi:hypothetical protein
MVGTDYVAVDGLGDVSGLVADRVGDVLNGDAIVAHDRDRRVAALVGVPVTDAGALGHLAEPVVEGVAGVLGAVFFSSG